MPDPQTIEAARDPAKPRKRRTKASLAASARGLFPARKSSDFGTLPIEPSTRAPLPRSDKPGRGYGSAYEDELLRELAELK